MEPRENPMLVADGVLVANAEPLADVNDTFIIQLTDDQHVMEPRGSARLMG